MIRNEHASAPLARAVIPTLPASGGLIFMLVGLGFWAAFGLMLLAAAVKSGLCAVIKAQLHHICIVQMCTPSRAHAETFYWVFNHVHEINPFRTAGRQDTNTSHPDVALDVVHLPSCLLLPTVYTFPFGNGLACIFTCIRMCVRLYTHERD